MQHFDQRNSGSESGKLPSKGYEEVTPTDAVIQVVHIARLRWPNSIKITLAEK